MPFSECGTVFAQINSHIKNLSPDNSHKLALGVLFLKMQAAQDTADRHTVIVLDKDHIQPCLLHIFLIIGLHKKTAVVLVDLGFYNEKAVDFCFCHCDLSQFSSVLSDYTLLFRPGSFPPVAPVSAAYR